MGEHLERAATGRSRCTRCKQPIEHGSLRMGIGVSGRFDGGMTIWQHALCAVLKNPAGFLRASAISNELAKAVREPFEGIANTIRARKLKQVIWRHATEPRCLIELQGDYYALLSSVDGTAFVVRGPLEEVIASVPDEDLQQVLDTAIACGKTVART